MEPAPDMNAPAGPDGSRAAPPRAFAQGVGVLLQTVGMLLFLLNCCICSLGGVFMPVQTRGQVLQQVTDSAAHSDPAWRILIDRPGDGGIMLTVMFSTVGGLALAVFGLGMQSDKPRAPAAATVTAAVLLLLLAAGGIGLWIDAVAWPVRLWHLLLLLTVAVLLGFCVPAWKQVRANPPTTQWQDVPPGLDLSYYYRKQPDDPSLSADDVAQQRARLETERTRLEAMERALRERKDQGG